MSGLDRRTMGKLFRWSGRCAALLLLWLWGSFFFAHLWEWFLRPGDGLPPAWVWLCQFFHFLMLVGLALTLRWERIGSIVLVVGTVAFFGGIGMKGFPTLALVNLIPIAFFVAAELAAARPDPTAAGPA